MKTFIGYLLLAITAGAPIWYVPTIIWLSSIGRKPTTEPPATLTITITPTPER